jgi:hypothetical protein
MSVDECTEKLSQLLKGELDLNCGDSGLVSDMIGHIYLELMCSFEDAGMCEQAKTEFAVAMQTLQIAALQFDLAGMSQSHATAKRGITWRNKK